MSLPPPHPDVPDFKDVEIDLPESEQVDPLVLELTPEQRQAHREAHARRKLARQRARTRRRRRRMLTAVLVVLGLLAALVFVWVRWTTGGLERIPVAMPAGPTAPGRTFLLVGSDPAGDGSRVTTDSWQSDLRGSELVMVVHVSANGRNIYAISLPHDLPVPIPGNRPGLLSSTIDLGGPALYLATVQQLIGVHIDHLAGLDLNGLREVIDQLGGVTATVPQAVCDDQRETRRLDGQSALEFIRLRPCFPNGDLDRVQRQQAVLKATLAGFVDSGSLVNPFRLNRIAHSTFQHLAVEDGWSLLGMAELAWSLRHIGPDRTTFLTVPMQHNAAGTGVLHLNEVAAGQLWQALRTDKIGEYLQLNADAAVLGAQP